MTPPALALDAASCTLPGENGWCRDQQAVHFLASDAMSGVASPCSGPACAFSRASSTNGANVMIASGPVCDAAGNCAPGLTAGPYQIDSVAPVLARNTSADGCSLPGDNGWCRGTQSAAFTASDATSGLLHPAQASFMQSTAANGSAVMIPSGPVCDVAGNCAGSLSAGPFKIDSVPPTLDPVVSPDPVAVNGTATVTPNASDGGSGVATASCGVLDTTTAGDKQVTCTATDHAGNSTSVIVAYSVVASGGGPSDFGSPPSGRFEFTGFLPPVDNLPVVNVAKAGQAIPVKWSLGGDYGLAILSAGFPKAQAVTCDTSAPSGAITETVSASTSGLSYDPITATYTYVWKTEKSWANSCRLLTVTLTDGSTQSASVKFTK